jgi:hypothetical protein
VVPCRRCATWAASTDGPWRPVDFRTPGGQRFDAFALDIEPSATTPRGALRDDNLRRLSNRLRTAVGRPTSSGAIVPSPIGLLAGAEVLAGLPLRHHRPLLRRGAADELLDLPGQRATATYDYTMGNIAFLRSVLGPTVSLHVIGGNASQSGRLETRAFVQACNDAGSPAPACGTTRRTARGLAEMAALDLALR